MIIKTLRWSILLVALLYSVTANTPAYATDSTRAVQPDSLKRPGTSKILLPALFYTPETKIGGGGAAGLFRKFSPNAPTSSIMAAVIYTQRGQIMASIAPDLYLKRGTLRLSGTLAYMDFPDLFYGIGNNTPDDSEEKFTARSFEVLFKAQHTFAPGFRVGPLYHVRYRSFTEFEENGNLESRTIPGSQNGLVSGPGVVIEWDRRDNQFFPEHGHYAEVWAAVSDETLGSDFNFRKITADFRKYTSLFPNHILAVQGFASMVDGTAPFHLLPAVGGPNVLRGYYDGRYRDNILLSVQAEYRFPLWNRLGGVLFAGTGDVASRFSTFTTRNLKHAGGAGLRYRVSDEGVNIRLDYALARTGGSFYITLQEAF